MKKFLLLLTAVLLYSCGTTQFGGTPETFTKIVINDKDKNENYVLANEWMVDAFKNAESVIQFSDKEAGVIKGKYFIKSYTLVAAGYGAGTQNVYATITLRVKDGAAKLEISTDSKFSCYKQGNVCADLWSFTPSMFESTTNSLHSSLSKSLTTGTTEW